MIACPEPDKAARVRKLLTENLLRSNETTYHFGMELNNLILERYRIDSVISKSDIHKYYQCDIDNAIESLELMYFLRVMAKKYVDINSDSFSTIRKDEEDMCLILQDASKVEQYNERKERKKALLDRLAEVDNEISEFTRENKKNLSSPIIAFLEKCSSGIVMIPADNTKADLIGLNSYKDVITAFSVNLDLIGASKKSLEILERKIEALSKVECKSDNDRNQNALAIQRNKIFRRSILFFVDKYEGKIPELTKMSPVLEGIYSSVEFAVNVYKKDYESKKIVSDKLSKYSDERQEIQNQIAEIDATSDELEKAEDQILAHMNEFIGQIFDSSYTMLGYKKNKPPIPGVKYSCEDNELKWILTEEVDERIRVVASDVLDWFVEQYRGRSKARDFKKVVFWINGLDEIEKIPNQLVEVIRNAINQNILVVIIITSELKDTTIRKAFDYAFVTGNIEKFYSMFNIKYTKQPLDSIVVNFGIRSKGFDIPFKMYKSNLEDIQAPNFIDQLLNA